MSDREREHIIASIERAMPYAEDGTIQFSVKVVKILLEMLKEQDSMIEDARSQGWSDGYHECEREYQENM